MATVDEIIKDIMATAPVALPNVAIAKWIDNRYKELCSKSTILSNRAVGELVIPATVSTGTVAVTRGSTTVTGTSTTFTSDVGSGTQEHFYFRAGNAWYKIASIASDTSLTLDSEYAETTSSSTGYEIVKRTHSLASDVRWLSSVVFPRLRFALQEIPDGEMEHNYPGRLLSSHYPMKYCKAGYDSNGNNQIEVYPVPQITELIRYVYYKIPTTLTISSTIPGGVDAHNLKEGALIDVYRHLKIDAIANGNVEAAGIYANDEARQRTVWRQYMSDALRTQRMVDDVTFAIKDFAGGRRPMEIRTAEDHVNSQWPQ